MNRNTVCALVLGLSCLPALAQTDPAPASAPASAPDADAAVPAAQQIVVEGRRPGPGVWKVSKGEHVMWIFGLYSPLPKKMEWDDSRVERLVKNSQEVLLPPNVQVGLSGIGGFFKGLVALPSLIGVQNNPDGATLHDVLPADVHARWTTLKAKYIGNDDGVERVRPLFAADRLLNAGLDKHGLTGGGEISERVVKIAEKNKVKRTTTGYGFTLDNPRELLRDFKKSQVEDLACFTRTLDSLDSDIDAMRVRANAWANGNVAELKRLDFAERDAECGKAILGTSAMKKAAGAEDIFELARRNWLQAAEKALDANAQTFAMLPMKNIFGADGALANLQAKGYTVESPK